MLKKINILAALLVTLVVYGCGPTSSDSDGSMVMDTATTDISLAMPNANIPIFDVSNIARKSFYFAGGDYVGDPLVMGGQMYVEVWEPVNPTQPYPIILFHGNGQTGVDWLQTPDGRAGWAYYLVEQGYTLYMVDYPARGRSAYLPGGVHGDLGIRTVEQLETIWTNVGEKGNFPLAQNHTQWPGTGKMGDPIFDNFIKTQVQFAGESTTLARQATMELIDTIGTPVILFTHSQGGGVGWGVADARHELVRGIVTVEPGGPQIRGVDTATVTYQDREANLYGPVNYPLTYEPPITDPSQLITYLEAEADQAGEVPCYLQVEPARQLANMQDMRVLAVSADGTYHRVFDACIPKWLNQAGVDTDFIRLEDIGISGNGHMMMLELNSDAIIEFIHGWIQENIT